MKLKYLIVVTLVTLISGCNSIPVKEVTQQRIDLNRAEVNIARDKLCRTIYMEVYQERFGSDPELWSEFCQRRQAPEEAK